MKTNKLLRILVLFLIVLMVPNLVYSWENNYQEQIKFNISNHKYYSVVGGYFQLNYSIDNSSIVFSETQLSNSLLKQQEEQIKNISQNKTIVNYAGTIDYDSLVGYWSFDQTLPGGSFDDYFEDNFSSLSDEYSTQYGSFVIDGGSLKTTGSGWNTLNRSLYVTSDFKIETRIKGDYIAIGLGSETFDRAEYNLNKSFYLYFASSSPPDRFRVVGKKNDTSTLITYLNEDEVTSTYEDVWFNYTLQKIDDTLYLYRDGVLLGSNTISLFVDETHSNLAITSLGANNYIDYIKVYSNTSQSRNTSYDLSSKKNHGTYEGYDFNDGTPNGGVTIDDGAMVFDGNNTQVSVTNPLNENTNTLSFWYYANEYGENNGFLSNDFYGDRGFSFTMSSSNRYRIQIRKSDDSRWYYDGHFNTVKTNVWTHICIVQNGNKLDVYENNINILDTTGDGNTIRVNSQDLYIGRSFYDNLEFRFFNGSISNAQIFDRALSQSEIQQIYNAGKDSYTPIGDGLVLQLSGKDFEGTKSNPTKILDTKNIVKGKYGTAGNFDGNTTYIDIGTKTYDLSSTSFSFWYNNYDLSKVSTPLSDTSAYLRNIWFYPSTQSLRLESNTNDDIATFALNSWLNNVWTHIVISCDDYVCSGYQDGNFLNSVEIHDNITLSYIGGFGTFQRGFNGQIDEVMIFNKSLTEEEVETIYEEQKLVIYNRHIHNQGAPSDSFSYDYLSYPTQEEKNEINISIKDTTTDYTRNYYFNLSSNEDKYFKYKYDSESYSSYYNSSFEELTDLLNFGSHNITLYVNFSNHFTLFTWNFSLFSGLFNLNLYDETTWENITTANITIFNDRPTSFFYNASKNKTFKTLGSGETRIFIEKPNYNFENLYVYIENSINESIDGYLLSNESSYIIVRELLTSSRIPVSNGYIDLYKYKPSELSYVRVTTTKTNSLGEGAYPIEPYSSFYKTYTRDELLGSSFASEPNPYQVIEFEDLAPLYYIEGYEEPSSTFTIRNLNSNFTFINTTNQTIARYSYLDNTGIVNKVEVIVYTRTLTSKTILCNTSLSASAGILLCPVNNTAYIDKLYAEVRVHTNTQHSVYSDIVEYISGIEWEMGSSGFFLSWLVTMSVSILSVIFFRNLLAPIIFNVVSIVISLSLGFFSISLGSVVTLIFAVVFGIGYLMITK